MKGVKKLGSGMGVVGWVRRVWEAGMSIWVADVRIWVPSGGLGSW